MSKLNLSLVFPAYNEEKNIGKTIEKALKAGQKLAKNFEVIVVNDGSGDRTKAIIENWRRKDARVKLINHPTNRGYGQTVWDGLSSAKGEWIFFSDGDLQFDLEEIEKLFDHTPQYKVVIGYRALRRDPLHRLINAKAWNILVRILFGLKVKDIDCAFKLFHRTVLADLQIKSKGAAFSLELLARLKKKGLEFKEVAVTHLPSRDKEPTGAKPKVILRAFQEMFKLYRGNELARPLVKDMIKFASVGAISTTLDVATLNLFYLVVKAGLYWSTFFGFMAGTANGYLMNNFWTYRRLHKEANPRDFIKLATIGAVGLGLTQLIMYLLAGRAGLYYNYAKGVAVVIVFFWNFFGARYFAFEVHKHKK